MSTSTLKNEEIKAGQVWIIPVYSVPNKFIAYTYDVTIMKVDESVYMVDHNGKTGIESLTSFQANVDAGNYIEVL